MPSAPRVAARRAGGTPAGGTLERERRGAPSAEDSVAAMDVMLQVGGALSGAQPQERAATFEARAASTSKEVKEKLHDSSV